MNPGGMGVGTEVPKGAAFGRLDQLLCVALVVLATAAAYHPYFFGDEIIQFRDMASAGSFGEALARMSEYKPRMIYNSLWAWGVVEDWERWRFALVNASSMAAVCLLLAGMAGRWFGAGRGLAWLLVATVLASRFAAMLYFDYIAGIIESLSLAFFLAALWATTRALESRRLGAALLASGLALSSTMVHERYVAATFALGCLVAAWSLFDGGRDRKRFALPLAATLALLPAVAYIGLHALLATHSVATGTGGMEVSIGLGTAKVFLTYMANALLATNFGNEWLVGSLNMVSPRGRLLCIAFALAAAAGWLLYALRIRRDPEAVRRAIALLVLMAALCAVASLPGEARQEGRWLYPVSALGGLLVLCVRSVTLRYLMLGFFLCVSLVHWISGSVDAIYNLSESRTARNLSQGVNNLRPQAGRALIAGMDYSRWTFGESISLAEFSRRNLAGRPVLEFLEPGNEEQLRRAEAAFVRVAPSSVRGGATFVMVTGPQLRVLFAPAAAEMHRGQLGEPVAVGGGMAWDTGWQWTMPAERRHGALVLGPAGDPVGHLELPASELDGSALTYRARTPVGGAHPSVALSVEWLDATGRSIGIATGVGSATAGTDVRLSAPREAHRGRIQVRPGDGAASPVVLESIGLRRPIMTSLAPRGDWSAWDWSGEPGRDGDGVILESPSRVVGTRSLDASFLDGKVLVYRARGARAGQASAMRLQVNWSGAGGRFLGTQIDVVQVGEEPANHAMLAHAPAGAVTGTVYANLHDGQDGPVVLERIDVVAPR